MPSDPDARPAAEAAPADSSVPPARPGTFASLRHRNYRYIWMGHVGHSATLWMENVVRPVLILQLTDSALMVGLVVAVRLAPLFLFALISGAAADRFDRRRLLMAAQVVTASTHLLIGALVVADLIQVWHVFLSAFVLGTAMAFNAPARQSLIGHIVPRRELLNATALTITATNIMRIAGGALAGLLLIPIGVGGVYLLNGVAYSWAVWTTFSLRLEGEGRPRAEREPWLDSIRKGVAFAARTPSVLYVLAPALILFVFGLPYQSVFVPLLAVQVLDLGDSGVGALVSVTGVGALVGSLAVASRAALPRRGLVLLGLLAVFATALVLLSRTSWLPAAIVLLALAGSMTVSYIALTNALLLEHSPPHLRGRVMSLMALDRGLVPVGSATAGALAAVLGPQDALLIMAGVCLALTAVMAVAAPALRRMI
jgi:MFS family permease